ncbi:hypothetical protein ACLMAL_23795 [Nocardia sp. CWNU-33]|uniref:hypothetical protein n=1 Tax=Nocardia sp. CWNU-33 TaxID=3392117 RepID=UPI00398EC7E5
MAPAEHCRVFAISPGVNSLPAQSVRKSSTIPRRTPLPSRCALTGSSSAETSAALPSGDSVTSACSSDSVSPFAGLLGRRSGFARIRCGGLHLVPFDLGPFGAGLVGASCRAFLVGGGCARALSRGGGGGRISGKLDVLVAEGGVGVGLRPPSVSGASGAAVGFPVGAVRCAGALQGDQELAGGRAADSGALGQRGGGAAGSFEMNLCSADRR